MYLPFKTKTKQQLISDDFPLLPLPKKKVYFIGRASLEVKEYRDCLSITLVLIVYFEVWNRGRTTDIMTWHC